MSTTKELTNPERRTPTNGPVGVNEWERLTSAATHELLTLAEVGKITRTAPRTVARWTADGRLPVVRIGRRVLVTRRAIDAFIETSTKTATTGPLAGRNL